MSTLGAADLQVVEEHLLMCPSCQKRQTETDAFVRAMRAAARAERDSEKRPARSSRSVWMLATALAAVVIAVVVIPRPARVAPVSVLLESTRGAGSPFARAPGDKPLLLDLDILGLPAAHFYRVEIVDSSGRQIRETMATGRDGRVRAQPPLRLAPGRYFVRLYSRTSGILREYGLEATTP